MKGEGGNEAILAQLAVSSGHLIVLHIATLYVCNSHTACQETGRCTVELGEKLKEVEWTDPLHAYLGTS